MPDGLKIMSKAGVILHDNAWLPGVHYSTTKEDNEEGKKTFMLMIWKVMKMKQMRMTYMKLSIFRM
jgi:hypothetical protein